MWCVCGMCGVCGVCGLCGVCVGARRLSGGGNIIGCV